MRKIIFFITLFNLPNILVSQTDVSKITEAIKADRLNEIEDLKKLENDKYAIARELAISMGLDTINVRDLDFKNEIRYFTIDNSVAAGVTNTDELHSGGSLGLNLDGTGFSIGIWEANDEGFAIPRTTHENLNTVTTGLHGDNGASPSEHGTHVAGTLVGNGTGNSSAKGMAPNADLWAFDLINRFNEIDLRASSGMLVSNHSYGTVSGWSLDDATGFWQWIDGNSTFVGGGEDVDFGLYDSAAALWDLHSVIHSNSLIVKSAGNDRDDNPFPGTTILNPSNNPITYDPNIHPLGDGVFDNNGYNSIPTSGTAKNILTVGAVDGSGSTTVMTTFSGWGPTDDGRIKPDLVGHGQTLNSSEDDDDSDYNTKSGTSMSSPNVAGSALLLQEYYEDLNGTGNFMRNATLKGLMIHTASDLGNLGPDYQFGWGLLNAEEAANIITEDDSMTSATTIIEDTHNGQDISYGFIGSCIHGSGIDITMAYSDEAGTSQTTETSTPNLVNDLDLIARESNSPNFQQRPWVLDPNNPTNPATKEDNDLDNVERLDYRFPNGVEIITVKAEGALALGSQDFSLIASGSGLEEICSVIEDQPNVVISSNNFCFDQEMTTKAIINSGSNTEHVSGTRIRLLPGTRVNSGSNSLFRIHECIYFF